MNKANTHNMFSPTNHPPTDDLVKYVQHQLEADAARNVELHMADCEPCSDAVDGLMSVSGNIRVIDKDLRALIEGTSTPPANKVIPLYKRWYFAVAAMLALVFVSGYVIIYFAGKNNTMVDMVNTNAQKEVPAPMDSPVTITQQPAKQLSAESSDEQSPRMDNLNKAVKAEENKDNVALNESPSDEIQPQNNVTATVPVLSQGGTAVDAKMADDVEKDLSSATQAQDKPANEEILVSEKRKESLSKKQSAEVPSKTPQVIDNIVKSETTSVKAKALRREAQAFDMNVYSQAQKAFSDKDYGSARPMFESLLLQSPNHQYANYYAGMCAYFQNDYKYADSYLAASSGDKHFEFYESVLWYRALALIQLGKPKEAKKLLHKVVDLNATKKDEAANLMKELR